MATTCCIDDLDRVLERALRVEGVSRAADAATQVHGVALLMKIVSERVLIFVRHLSAAPRQCWTDDAESIMLEVVFGDVPDGVVGSVFWP